MTIKTKYIVYGILLSLIGILIGSLSHLSMTYASLEHSKEGFVSWILAMAIEAGLLAISFGIAERRRQNKSVRNLMVFLFLFGLINFFCNTNYSLSVLLDMDTFGWDKIITIDWYTLLKVFVTSSSLPILMLALTELYSIFLMKLKREQQEEKYATMSAEEKIIKAELKKKMLKEIKLSETPDEEIEDQILGIESSKIWSAIPVISKTKKTKPESKKKKEKNDVKKEHSPIVTEIKEESVIYDQKSFDEIKNAIIDNNISELVSNEQKSPEVGEATEVIEESFTSIKKKQQKT